MSHNYPHHHEVFSNNASYNIELRMLASIVMNEGMSTINQSSHWREEPSIIMPL